MNHFFEGLRESNEFLNLLLDSIDAAVLLADKDMNIRQFNNSFVNLFKNAEEGTHSFGQAASCVHCVKEGTSCGVARACGTCLIRKSLKTAFLEKKPVINQRMTQRFSIRGRILEKHLRFSMRPIRFGGQEMMQIVIHDMTELESQRIELEEKQRQLDQDLLAAAGIQQSLLPQPRLSIKGLDFAWKFIPCHKIGGDIFNLHEVDRDHVCLYMLDVAGHGMPSALISVAVSHFLMAGRSLFHRPEGPAQPAKILNKVNEAFPFERLDSYFSMLCMLIDRAGQTLTYGCAGHPPPVLMGKNGPATLEKRGPVIGLSNDLEYSQETVPFGPGDKVVLYTDGALECADAWGELFGNDRFLASLKKNANRSVWEMVQGTVDELAGYVGQADYSDDISLLALEMRARDAGEEKEK